MKTREEYNAYMRDYMLRRYHKRREEAFKLLGGYCVRCGNEDNLEVDHIDPRAKAFDIFSRTWSMPHVKFLAEIAKCQLLCRACHRDKSNREMSVGHGGGKTGKKNCRCDLCRPLKNKYIKDYKRRQRAASMTGTTR